MIVVIFEVEPRDGRADEYFDLAAELTPEIEKFDGFISIERFESRTQKGKYLSLSYWRDEEAVEAWYRHAGHRAAQAKGRGGIFDNYHLRVASVFRDYDMAHGRP